MTSKAETFFKKERWFHGTTLAEWNSICKEKIQAEYNIGISLDFGNGFYLSPKQKDAEKYAMDTVKYNGSDEPLDNVPVVIQFDFKPFDLLENKELYKYFAKYDDEFALFVFNCRENYMHKKTHSYDITGGVMTDAIPTKLMQEFFAGVRTKEDVLESFKKGTSKKQLCLHTQELCNKIINTTNNII